MSPVSTGQVKTIVSLRQTLYRQPHRDNFDRRDNNNSFNEPVQSQRDRLVEMRPRQDKVETIMPRSSRCPFLDSRLSISSRPLGLGVDDVSIGQDCFSISTSGDDLRAAEFLKEDCSGWDACKVDQFFLSLDRDCILSIPLGVISSRDVIIWHFDKKGRYTVKNGYRVAMDDTVREACSNSSADQRKVVNVCCCQRCGLKFETDAHAVW
ncbi:hypothetical protein ACOSQ2_002830 [Xanthoceras sorbifolium]